MTVEGAASLRLKPDGVSFSVGVETRGASAKEAFSANAKKVAAVVEGLKAGGVADAEIQTSRLDVSTVTSNSGTPVGFSVSNLVTVRRRDVESAASLLQGALAAGANQVGGLRFFVSDPASSQKQGLDLAFRDARAKAETLAALSGKQLGEVVCVSEGPRGARPVDERFKSLGYVAAPSVEPGAEEMPYAVSATFELK